MTTTSFQTTRHFFVFIFLPALLIMSACSKEKKENTAADHISKSEQLAIPPSVALPDNLPGGNTRVATFYATGVQKYKAVAKAGTNPVTYEWVLTGPDAELFDASNKKAGSHGAGPSWKLSGSNDSIYAQAYNPPRTAPSAGNVDWLLLMPKNGYTPSGIFSGVEYIQRIATQGGRAPINPPQSAAETVQVPYTAIYRFSKKKS